MTRLSRLLTLLPILVLLLQAPRAHAWGSDGHRMIVHTAAVSLPADVPAFLHTPSAIATLEYLTVEPDERWRQSDAEPELYNAQAPEHFIDMEVADLIAPLPRRRYDYVRALAAAAAKHPDLASDLTPEKSGLQPYAANEVWERLKSAFREYRREQAAHQDTAIVESTILFYTGWLSHYVGDGSMPLHTTINYNGWVYGPNPHGYTTEHRIHSAWESTYVHANIVRGDFQSLIPATPHPIADEWDDYIAYLHRSNALVERVYQLYQSDDFAGKGSKAAKAFTCERLAAGATQLRDMIVAAWQQSANPVRTYNNSEMSVPRPKETATN